MKRLIIFFCISMFSSIVADGGSIIGLDFSPGSSYNRINLKTVQDTGDYLNGGRLFLYPTEIEFNQNPRVYVSVELNLNSSLTDPYVAVISANSTTDVTIKVYRIDAVTGTSTEAANNEVQLHIFAIEILESNPV